MEPNIVDTSQTMPPIESSNPKRPSFLSRYVMIVSLLLILGIIGLAIYLLVNNKPGKLSSNIQNEVTSSNCTNDKVYTDLTEALQLGVGQICYIDAKAPAPEYVFPSDIVKHDNTRNLVSLSLSGYDLSAMQDSLGVLQNLKVLKLTNARLTTLPKGIDQLSKLEELDLSGNEFSDTAKEQIRQKLPNVKVTF